MITIIKDGNKMKCSQNTYDTMYKRLGYEILQETPIEEIKEKAHKIVEETKDKDLVKPLKDAFKEEPKEVVKKTKVQKNTKNKSKKGE